MRIALIYDAVYPWVKGGGEKYLYELAVQLRDHGHEPHMFGMHWWDGPDSIVREGIHYHALCRAAPLYQASGRRSLLTALRFAVGVLWRYPKHRRKDFDLINVVAFPSLAVPAFWLVHCLFVRRCPWFVTWFEVYGRTASQKHLGQWGPVAALAERVYAWLAPANLCISPTTARRLQEFHHVSPRQITVIPAGFERPAEMEGAVANKQRWSVVVAGRLVSDKRVDLVIRAWPHVLARLPEAQLHVIGDGPARAACEQLAAGEGVAGAVCFHGQLADWHDVLRRIASAALLLQPSPREGQSLVVLEAMTLGTPVLAADGPETAVGDFIGSDAAMPQALLPVEAGPEAWADRIVQLLTDDALAQRLAERGRAAALGWKEIMPRTLAFYQSLIQKP